MVCRVCLVPLVVVMGSSLFAQEVNTDVASSKKPAASVKQATAKAPEGKENTWRWSSKPAEYIAAISVILAAIITAGVTLKHSKDTLELKQREMDFKAEREKFEEKRSPVFKQVEDMAAELDRLNEELAAAGMKVKELQALHHSALNEANAFREKNTMLMMQHNADLKMARIDGLKAEESVRVARVELDKKVSENLELRTKIEHGEAERRNLEKDIEVLKRSLDESQREIKEKIQQATQKKPAGKKGDRESKDVTPPETR